MSLAPIVPFGLIQHDDDDDDSANKHERSRNANIGIASRVKIQSHIDISWMNYKNFLVGTFIFDEEKHIWRRQT